MVEREILYALELFNEDGRLLRFLAGTRVKRAQVALSICKVHAVYVKAMRKIFMHTTPQWGVITTYI